MNRSLCLGAALLLACAACASAGTAGGSGSAASTTAAPRSSSTLIAGDQIAGRGFSTALDVVQSVRPNWLNSRGPNSFGTSTEVQVYLDGSRLGGPDNLKNISANGISYIQYYDGTTASARWGLDHGSGVIWVSTTPRR